MPVEFRRHPDTPTGARVKLMRLGLFDPDPSNPGVAFVGRRYADTPRNRAIVSTAIAKYNQLADADPDMQLCMGVFLIEEGG